MMKRILVGAMLGLSTVAAAQSFPSRPVTMIVATVPGGSTDFTARLLQEPLSKALGQPVLVENRGGASGNIGTELVARAKPDGHTLLLQFSGFHVGNPHLFKGLKWDPVKDFTPIAMALYAPQVIAVGPSTRVTTMKELVELVRANPGKVSYGSSGAGSIQHLSGEILEQQAGGKMIHVPYKGSGPAVVDLMGGNIDVFITTPPGVIQQVRAGKLRALGVTSLKRAPAAPDIPTLDESGVKGFDANAWFGFYAPGKMASELAQRLNSDVVEALKTPKLRALFAEQGADPGALTQAEFTRFVSDEMQKWGKVIATANVKAE